MRPILFEIFGFAVRSYSLFIGVAFLAALWLARRVAKRRRPEYVGMVDDFATIALVSAIIGARVWEVAFTWDYYRDHLSEIVAVWHGGISIQGAIAGGASDKRPARCCGAGSAGVSQVHQGRHGSLICGEETVCDIFIDCTHLSAIMKSIYPLRVR